MTRRAAYARRLAEAAIVAGAALAVMLFSATIYVAAVFGQSPLAVVRVFLSEAWHVNIPMFALAMLVAFNTDGAK